MILAPGATITKCHLEKEDFISRSPHLTPGNGRNLPQVLCCVPSAPIPGAAAPGANQHMRPQLGAHFDY